MSVEGWNTVLVLGGIRSGKSEFAEALVVDAPNVRYVATAANDPGDPQWTSRIEAHRQRRPAGWSTEEVGADPARLATLIAEAKPDETLLVDDLGGWVTGRLAQTGAVALPESAARPEAVLAAAVAGCEARLVIVSPEVGWSLVPTTPLGRAFADALGDTNQAVAAACDAVVLVVAGQATWLKPSAAEVAAAAITAPEEPPPTKADAELPPVVTPAPPVVDALTAPTMALPVVGSGQTIQPGMDLPMPDEDATAAAHTRLSTLDVPGAGLGELGRVVTFAAGTQGSAVPRPWRAPRLILLDGDHAGGAAAGSAPEEARRRAELARGGGGPLGVLAARAGATMQVVDAPAAAAIEDGPALPADAVADALRYGWRLVEEAVDGGADVLILGACGAGTDMAAAAVVAATTGAEGAKILPRAIAPGGRVDDAAWMVRCAALRDALHRIRDSPRGAYDVLAELGGGDIAIATGILLGATAHRTPVLLDGAVGAAAALVSRDLAGQARHWCLLTDDGRNPTVRHAADVLGLTAFTDLRIDLGEGATALAALPTLVSAVALAAALPAHPDLPPDGVPEPTTEEGPELDTDDDRA